MMTAPFVQLVWKDLWLIKSLVLIISFAIVITNAAIVISYSISPNTFHDGGVALLFWSLFPNLLAFGLPALLIGTEEESGTLAWLRTLPIPRYKVIYSKLLVGASSVGALWVLCTAVLMLVRRLAPRLATFPLRTEFLNSEFFDDVFIGVYFSVMLLLIGYVTSYLFRSPVAALLAVLPITLLSVSSYFQIFEDRWDWNDPAPLLTMGAYLMALVVLQHRLALRRLRPAFAAAGESSGYSLANAVHVSAQQSSSDVCLSLQLRLPIPRLARATRDRQWLERPSVTRALLWQAQTQQAMAIVFLAPVIVAICFFPLSWMTMPAFGLVMSWLGSTTFSADTLGRRQLFFGERGITTLSLWFTRMALPSAMFLGAAVIHWSQHGVDGSFPLSIGLVAFAIGSLMSLAAARPVLGWIVSPVLLFIYWITFWMLFHSYPDYWPAVGLTVIPIFFATWRLLRRWSLGRRGIGFDARVLAYLMLGLLLVSLYIVGHRIATTPAARPLFRKAMFAQVQPRAAENTELLQRFMATRQAFDQMYYPNAPGDDFARITRLLNVTKDARLAMLNGEIEADFFFAYVEQDETAALELAWLHVGNSHIRQIDAETAADWLAAMSSTALRRQSREVALIEAWNHYQAQSWADEKLPGSPYGSKQLFGKAVAVPNAQFSFERLRADRYIDAATQATLDYLRKPETFADDDDDERRQLERLWQNVSDSHFTMADRSAPFDWEADELAAKLRAALKNTIDRAEHTNGAGE